MRSLDRLSDAAEAVELLDLDEAYDTRPDGEPPIRTATYRAALRAALAVSPHGPRVDGLRAVEIDAYRAGQADSLDEVARTVATTLSGRTADE